MPNTLGTALRFFVVGFIAGLLLAPRTGKESRQLLWQAADSLLGSPEPSPSPGQRLHVVEQQIASME